MKLQQNKPAVAGLLLTVAAVWGGAFVFMKDSLQRMDVNSFLAVRFFCATVLLIVLKPSALKRIDRAFFIKGVITGTLLASGYIFQSFGLTLTTIAKTGFITGLYAVIVPLISALLFHKHVSKVQWLAVAIAMLGLALMSFRGFSVGLGEFLVLISAIIFALHIIALGEWSANHDTYALTILQLGTVTVLAFLASLKSGFHMPPDRNVWISVLFTAVFSTSFAFIIQTWTQSFMNPTTIGIILTMEYIFAAAGAVAIAHEQLTLRTLLGGALVISAMYVIIWADGREKIPA